MTRLGSRRRVPTPPDPRDLDGDFGHRVTIEVRFRDTDAMGHVNNAVYHTYVEHGRVRYLRDVIGEGLRRYILAESRLVHRSPVFFGEHVTVETRVVRIGRSSIDMEHRLTVRPRTVAPAAADDVDTDTDADLARLVAIATSTLVQYDYERGAPTPVPDEAVDAMSAHEGRPLRGSPPA